MKKFQSVAIACFGLLGWQNVSACMPPYFRTAYFGQIEYADDALREKILADVRENHYVIIEQKIGLSYFPLVEKKGVIYLDGEPIAGVKDHFKYYGQGYYRLNQALYFLGEKVADYQATQTFTARWETVPAAAEQRADLSSCNRAKHLSVLESSNGLRVERTIYDN